MSLNIDMIAILSIHGADCCCIISEISKSEAIKLMQNIDLTKKEGYWNIKHLLSHIKIGKNLQCFVILELKNIDFTVSKVVSF